MDEATKAVGWLFKEFKEKCENYDKSKDEELLSQPTLSTNDSLLSILGMHLTNSMNHNHVFTNLYRLKLHPRRHCDLLWMSRYRILNDRIVTHNHQES